MSKFYFLFILFFLFDITLTLSNPLDSCDVSISYYPNNICKGDSLGSVNYKIRKGQPPFEIQTSFENKDSLLVGEYYILVTDSLGCFDSIHFEIFKPEPFEAGIKLHNTGICSKTVCASINGNHSYNVNWNNGLTGPCFEVYSLGELSADVTDIYGCTESVSITIDSSNFSGINLEHFANVMIPACKDSLELNSFVNGNKSGVLYNWTGPNAFSSNESAVTISDTGNYSLIVTNDEGCSDSQSFTVGKRSIEITPIFKQQLCTNKLIKVEFDVDGAKGPYSIDYPKLSTVTDSLPVILTDSDGCVVMEKFALPDQTPFSSFVNQVDDLTCINDSVIICPTVINGTEPYTFSWTNSGGIVIGDSSCAVITEMGEFDVEIIDSTGCITHDNFYVPSYKDIPSIDYLLQTEITIKSGDCTDLPFTSSTPNIQGDWKDSDGTSLGDNPEVCEAGVYTLVVTDLNNGCTNTGTITVEIETANINIENQSIKIYPNPTADLIQIDFSEKIQGTISLYSLQGQQLKQTAIQNRIISLDLGDLSNGVYFLKIESGNGIYYKKIFKQ